MNISLENLPQCQAIMRVEVPSDAVKAARRAVTRTFVSRARIPGYRPGKAPEPLVQKRFQKDILDELESRLVDQGFHEGVEANDLKVISITGLKDRAFHPDDSFSFTAEVLLAPEFELPEYKGIEVQIPKLDVTGEEVDRTLEGLRERLADYVDIEGRGLQMGDFAVINYSAALGGQPLAEAVPQAAGYVSANQDFWLKMDEQSFLPGFCNALIDAEPGAVLPVKVIVPGDFPLEALREKEVVYDVEIKTIKEQKLPEIDDAFAGKIEAGKTLEDLRALVREQHLAERRRQLEDLKTNQIIAFLDGELKFDLPGDLVTSETQRQVNDMVYRGQMQGMREEDIREHQQEIIHSASNQARMNVKTSFILEEIAEKEGIEPTEREILGRIAELAARQQIPAKKLLKEIRKNNGIGRIANSIRISKTLDFLRANASVKEVDSPVESTA